MKYHIASPHSFPLSIEQESAYAAIMRGESAAVNAGAGSGKSHTARCTAKNYSRRCEFIPFGRALADEEARVFSGFGHVNSQNFHPRGKHLCGNVDVDTSKLYKMVKELENVEEDKEKGTAELCKFLKAESVGVLETALSPEQVAIKYGFDPEFVPLAMELLKASDACHHIIDYNDMVRFPVMHGKRAFIQDALAVLDEVQDYTPEAFAFLTRCLLPKGSQVLMIGDPERQCLQAFAGASPAVFAQIAEHFDCENFELTVNRRCSKAVVDAAPFKGHMVALDDAPQGEVGNKDLSEIIDAIMAGEYRNDAVISEANAPLVTLGINLLTKGLPVQMRTARLEKEIYRICPFRFLDTRQVRVGEVANRVRMELQQREAEGNDLAQANDIANAIESLESYCLAKGIVKPAWKNRRPVHPIFQALNQLCNGKEGVTLLTGHTAKGLEWNTVFHLAGKMRDPEQDWQHHQANCLAHVIATRAKLNHYRLIEPEKPAAPMN